MSNRTFAKLYLGFFVILWLVILGICNNSLVKDPNGALGFVAVLMDVITGSAIIFGAVVSFTELLE